MAGLQPSDKPCEPQPSLQPLEGQAQLPPSSQSQTATEPQPQSEHKMKVQPNPTALTPSSVPTPTGPPSQQFAPPVGTRIEVLWRIESDDVMDDGTSAPLPSVVDRWWGAVVQDCTNEPVGPAVQQQYANVLTHILLYDAWGEFAEDTARVAFLPGSTLVDLARLDEENQGMLDWRMEGSEGSAEPSRPLSLAQVANEQEALVQEAGLSSDADLQALSQFPANVQLHMTSGYRIFADGIKEMLGELVAAKPPGYVVTEADVQTIFARIQAIKKKGEQVHAGM